VEERTERKTEMRSTSRLASGAQHDLTERDEGGTKWATREAQRNGAKRYGADGGRRAERARASTESKYDPGAC